MSGWIKLHRCITNHWLYTENRVYSKYEAWMDILLNVNFASAKVLIKGKLYDVKRGQSILSMESWGKRWNWDKSKVRRFMDLLQKDSMIVLKTDNTTTHLTVCNFESYQDIRHANETQMTHKQNTDEFQTNTIKEEKENKEEKELNDMFNILWNLYNKKKSKEEAFRAFKKIPKKEYDNIRIHIPVFVKQFSVKPFQPYFATYLNGKRWQDEISNNTQNFKLTNIATLNDD
jgi:hypothetical protein